MKESNVSVDRDMKLGFVWLVGMRMVLKLISVISTLILVRILTPEDFGIVALAMSFYALVELLSAFGFESAIVRITQANDGHYSTVWTLRIIVSLGMWVFFFTGAGAVASFYSDTHVEYVIQILSFLFMVNAIKNPGMIKVIKDMDFKTEFNYQCTSKLSSFLITIAAALWYENYYALIIGMYSSSIINVALSYMFSKFRPVLTLSYAAEIFGFSKWMLLNAWINYLNARSSEVVLGFYGSKNDVGLYNVGSEIAMLPVTEVGAALNRSSYSGYSRVDQNRQEIKALFLSVLCSISMITIPVGIGIFLLAGEISGWVLGGGWESTKSVIEYIALASIFSALTNNHQYIYMAFGKPRLTTAISAIKALFLIMLLLALTPEYGIAGAALAMLIASVVYVPIPMFLTARLLDIKFHEYSRSITRYAVSAFVMAVTVKGVALLADSWSPATMLVLKSILGAVVYVAMVYVIWVLRGGDNITPEGQIIQFVKKRLPS